MLQRILGVVLVLAGLGAIAFGVATATVLRESDSVVATARPAGDGTLVVTDPGVLGLVDSEVTVTASVPEGQEVAVVVGREVDVMGWLGEDPHTRVTGLSDWETLSTEQVAGAADEEAEPSEDGEEGAEADPPPNPAGSDMWDTELVDAEQVSLRWSDRPGRWVLLAAATGPAPAEESEGEDADAADAEQPAAPAEAPTLELTWDRDVSTPLLWPAVGVGGVLLVVGLVLLLAGRRSPKSRSRRTATAAAGASAASTTGTSSPATPGPGSTTSPFGPTAGGAAAGAATSRLGGAWPGSTSAPRTAPADDTTPSGADASEDELQDDSTGTAPVPVAGRFRRRTRLRRDAAQAEDGAAPVPASAPSTGAPPVPAPVPAPPAAADAPAAPSADTGAASADTAGRPLTRRELRRREEERKAAEQSGMGGGMGRALRALTGQTPVVPGPGAGSPSADDPGAAPSAADRRAAAWRETWGFGGTGASPTSDDDTTDEDKR